MKRREFLKGCSAAITAMCGARTHSVVFGQGTNDENVLITVFLRGGADVLNLIPPTSGSDRGYYEAARPDLQIDINDALHLEVAPFGLHPAMQGMHELFMGNKLAIVQATGLMGAGSDTRSHFDAMSYMELGTPGQRNSASGWLARHLQTSPALPDTLLFPAVAMGDAPTQAFLSNTELVPLRNPQNVEWTYGAFPWQQPQRAALRRLYAGEDAVRFAGTQALDMVDIIEAYLPTVYTPKPGVIYPENDFGNQLKILAQMIKADMGVRMASVDLGGWDTHNSQSSNSFYSLITTLSDGLTAFYNDLDTSAANAPINKVTVAVMSEFGRKLRENDDLGTDHGHGGAMFVLGGAVSGGVYGDWPGLRNEELYDGRDLAVTTDYRQVLSEILIRRHSNPNLGSVFPNYANYQPLGLVEGNDLTPNYDDWLADGGTLPDNTSPPLSIGLQAQQAQNQNRHGIGLVAGAGVALTAGLVALRARSPITKGNEREVVV